MAAWQLILLGVFVIVPLLLLSGFHPRRERLGARGRPVARDWDSTGARQVEEHEAH